MTCKEKFAKSALLALEICEQTDRDTHTDMLIAIIRTPAVGKVNIGLGGNVSSKDV